MLGPILKRCAPDKSKKLRAKAGRPCASARSAYFFRTHIFDENLMTQTVKPMELKKMMTESRDFNSSNS